MDYRLISVDDHIDLQYMPAGIWQERVPSHLADQAPAVVGDSDGNPVWVCDQKVLSRWAGGRADGQPVVIKRSYETALERGGHHDETELRPTNPELRLADMDRDNIEATVMYGPATVLDIGAPELRRAVYRAYNEWLVEFCDYDPRRLIGVALLPAEDPAGAIAELRRLAAEGQIRQVAMHIGRVSSPIHGPEWEPFWDEIEASGIIASFHLVLEPAMLRSLNERAANIYETSKLFINQFLDPLVGLLAEGVLERRPTAKLVLAESGLGWLPWLVQELDYRYQRLVSMQDYWTEHGGIGLDLPPSEVFKRQIWVTFQDDLVGLDLVRHFGADKVMWACDYPHPDSTFPESAEVITRLTSHLDDDTRRRVLRSNAESLYTLEPAIAPALGG